MTPSPPRSPRILELDAIEARQAAEAEEARATRGNTATITGLTVAGDGVVLVHADCDRCRKSVLHGAGDDLDDLVLGHRMSHCGCPSGYELVDGLHVVDRRVRALRRELGERAAR